MVHFDETGLRVNQQLWWLHVGLSQRVKLHNLRIPNEVSRHFDAMEIEPESDGKAVHDGWQRIPEICV